MSDAPERLWWEYTIPANPEPVRLEHTGCSEVDGAFFLIGQGAIPHRTCACCGNKTPINGVKVRLVRQFGDTLVPGEWRTYPLARAKGGN